MRFPTLAIRARKRAIKPSGEVLLCATCSRGQTSSYSVKAMTNYSRLLEDRRIEREPGVQGQVAQQLSSAPRDLQTARKLLAGEDEWAYTIAYNAMLLAGRAVMFSEGYRPTSTGVTLQ